MDKKFWDFVSYRNWIELNWIEFVLRQLIRWTSPIPRVTNRVKPGLPTGEEKTRNGSPVNIQRQETGFVKWATQVEWVRQRLISINNLFAIAVWWDEMRKKGAIMDGRCWPAYGPWLYPTRLQQTLTASNRPIRTNIWSFMISCRPNLQFSLLAL